MSDIRRPWPLKQRIKSKIGHLSNRDAGKLLAEVAGERLKTVMLAHISQDCNTPTTAEDTVRHYLHESGHDHIDVVSTHQHKAAKHVIIS